MKKLATLFIAALLLTACAAKPKYDPLYEEIMNWQPRSVKPSMSYTYQHAPMPQTINVWHPALGQYVPITIMPPIQYGPTWGMTFNSDGSSDLVINVAPGFQIVY